MTHGRSMRVWKISRDVVSDIMAGMISTKSDTNVLGFHASICRIKIFLLVLYGIRRNAPVNNFSDLLGQSHRFLGT